MITNKLNRSSNISRERLNGDGNNAFSTGKWLGSLGLLQRFFHGVGGSLPFPVLQLGCGLGDGS